MAICNTPILVNNIFAGDIYIPFVLEMPDGTTVNELTVGGVGTVLAGKGVIELIEPAIAGQILQVVVDDVECVAYSCTKTVLELPDDCGVVCNPCHIRLVDLEVVVVAEIYAEIINLTVESSGALMYKLDNGLWFDNWRDIGVFTLGASHNIKVKRKTDPSCTETYPLIVVQKTVNIEVGVPTAPTAPAAPSAPIAPSAPAAPAALVMVYKLSKCGTGEIAYMSKTQSGLVGTTVAVAGGLGCYTVIAEELGVSTLVLGTGFGSCAECIGGIPYVLTYKLAPCSGGAFEYMYHTLGGLMGQVVSVAGGGCYTVVDEVMQVPTKYLSASHANCGACGA